ncbi:MAG: hypothetical protein IT287_01255 [Bdellovibrionaceae bacterium]|nr:hypothetical protein [Pseudobdellovibrionaceae bacterium]
MKIFIFILLLTLTSSAFAECITAESSAAEKAAMGVNIRRLTGGVTSWTEVKAGTSIRETKNTITINANFSNPFNSRFRMGKKSSSINAICSSGGAIIIKAAEGNVTIKSSNGRLMLGTIIGTYQVMPTSKVRDQKAEGPVPRTPVYEVIEKSTGVII